MVFLKIKIRPEYHARLNNTPLMKVRRLITRISFDRVIVFFGRNRILVADVWHDDDATLTKMESGVTRMLARRVR